MRLKTTLVACKKKEKNTIQDHYQNIFVLLELRRGDAKVGADKQTAKHTKEPSTLLQTQ